MAHSFRDLKIWQNGYGLLMEIYRITAEYPEEEKYGLISDTRRSANSVIANIAEAHGRYYFADKSRVLYQSRGETEEIRSHLSVAQGLGYIDKNTFERLDSAYEGLSKGISSYVSSLKRQKKENLIL